MILTDSSTLIHLEIDSSQQAISNSLSRVCNRLRHSGLSDEALSTAEIVLAEVLNNVAEHAYANEPGHVIDLKIDTSAHHLLCRVVDQGGAMPGGEMPIGDAANIDVPDKDLPEGGFGWFMIRQLTRDLTYRRYLGQNVLGFSIPTV